MIICHNSYGGKVDPNPEIEDTPENDVKVFKKIIKEINRTDKVDKLAQVFNWRPSQAELDEFEEILAETQGPKEITDLVQELHELEQKRDKAEAIA